MSDKDPATLTITLTRIDGGATMPSIEVKNAEDEQDLEYLSLMGEVLLRSMYTVLQQPHCDHPTVMAFTEYLAEMDYDRDVFGTTGLH